jgi:hypothetical protein
VQPVSLSVRQVEGPGNQLPGLNSAYASLSGTRSQHGDTDIGHSSGAGPLSNHAGGRARRGETGTHDPAAPSTGFGGRARAGPTSRSGLTPRQADAQLMAINCASACRGVSSNQGSAAAAGPAAWTALAPAAAANSRAR